MEFSELAVVISTVVSLASLAIVLIELRLGRQQNKVSSLIQVYNTNRELVSLGFSQPELFEVIGTDASRDDGIRRRYLQLWLNQIALIFQLEKHHLFSPEQWESLKNDVLDFMCMPAMQKHWAQYRHYYPTDLQAFIDEGVRCEDLGTSTAEPASTAQASTT